MTIRKLYVGLNNPIDGESKVNVYDLGTSGTAPPERSIRGPSTKLSGIESIALDGLGNLYVSSKGGVTVYDPNADGDAKPIRTLNICGYGLAVDSYRNLYVLRGPSENELDKVEVYSPDASGADTPIRTIAGIVVKDRNSNGSLNAIAVDNYNNNLYVCQPGFVVFLPERNLRFISVYPFGADGLAPADRTIRTVSSFTLQHSMDFDRFNNLYVMADGVDAIDSTATGETAPIRTIVEQAPPSKTEMWLDDCFAVDQLGVVYVGTWRFNDYPPHPGPSPFPNAQVKVYDAGANGLTAPIRTLFLDSGYGLPAAMAINNRPTNIQLPSPSVPDLGKKLGLVAEILGGLARDGDGLVFIGGVWHRVGPWTEVSAKMLAQQDILIGLAIDQLVSGVGDQAGQSKVRRAALELVGARVDELLASLG